MRLMLLNDLLLSKDQITLIFLISIGVIILGILVSFLISNLVEKKHISNIKDFSNTLRVYVVDVKNDLVSYFNSSNLRDRKTSSITTFYNQFSSKDRELLITWIGDLLNKNEDVSNYLEATIFVKSKKTTYTSILEVTKVDHRNQIVYLESHLLQVNPKSRHKAPITFAKKETLRKTISASSGVGITFGINFFNKITKTNDISHLAYVDLKNVLCSFINDKTMIAEEEFGKVVITKLDINETHEIYQFIGLIRDKVNKLLQIKSFVEEIDYTVGVINNEFNYRNVNALIRNVLALAEYGKDDPQQVLFFSEMKNLMHAQEGQQYRSDVETIIQENKLKYLFQPYFDTERKRIDGYIASVIPVNSYFKNIDDLKNYAVRTEDDKELFTVIVKNLISRFSQETYVRHIKLCIPITLNELRFAGRILSRIQNINELNVALILKEKDFAALPDDNNEDAIIDLIRAYRSRGYDIALQIDDNDLTLSPALYSSFTYFNISVVSHITKKNAGRNIPSFQALVENLLKFEKPIMASDIGSWDIVELVHKLGIVYICSDAIALPDENILPLPRKIFTKLLNLKS